MLLALPLGYAQQLPSNSYSTHTHTHIQEPDSLVRSLTLCLSVSVSHVSLCLCLSFLPPLSYSLFLTPMSPASLFLSFSLPLSSLFLSFSVPLTCLGKRIKGLEARCPDTAQSLRVLPWLTHNVKTQLAHTAAAY